MATVIVSGKESLIRRLEYSNRTQVQYERRHKTSTKEVSVLQQSNHTSTSEAESY
jgi:hypothetical protein